MTAWKLDKYGYPVKDTGRTKRDADGLSPTQRRTQRQKAKLSAGRHPATNSPLLDEPDTDDQWGFTCRDCVHSFRYRPGNTTVWKCWLQFRQARGSSEATDIRIGWPACTHLRIASTDHHNQRKP